RPTLIHRPGPECSESPECYLNTRVVSVLYGAERSDRQSSSAGEGDNARAMSGRDVTGRRRSTRKLREENNVCSDTGD
ncbi:hypothetical protein AB205_0075510, partial [Aquarana catesbeiana]